MAIIPDAFTTGFEEHMSTFSQEVHESVAWPGVGYVSLGCSGWKGIYGLSSHYIL